MAGAAFGGVHVSLFAWQAQHLVKFMCHFSWQAQHVVKFGMIAGAGNVVIFNRICSWRVRKVASVARRVAVCVFCDVGSIIGSWQAQYFVRLEGSDRSRIGNDFSCFQLNFCGVNLGFILRGRRSIW